MAFVVFLRRVGEDVTLLGGRNIQQPGLRAVGRRKPVGGSQCSRAGSRALQRRIAAGYDNRTPISANFFGPVEPWEKRLGRKELTVRPVQYIQKSISIRVQQQLTRLPLPRR